MKKLLSLAAVVLTAALIFSGCQNASSSSDDGDKLPGTWLSSPEFKNYTSQPFAGTGVSSLTNGGSNKFEYKVTSAGSCTETIDSTTISSVSYPASKDADYTGFKATVKSSASAHYGFAFNINIVNSEWTYYYILLSDNSYTVKFSNKGSATTLKDWEQNNAIKEAKSENKITVYTDKDSKIHIVINGSDVYQIENPAVKQGSFGPVCCLTGTDKSGNRSFTTTYTFTEAQKK